MNYPTLLPLKHAMALKAAISDLRSFSLEPERHSIRVHIETHGGVHYVLSTNGDGDGLYLLDDDEMAPVACVFAPRDFTLYYYDLRADEADRRDAREDVHRKLVDFASTCTPAELLRRRLETKAT